MKPCLEEFEPRIVPDATTITGPQLLLQMEATAVIAANLNNFILGVFPPTSTNPVTLFSGLIATNALFTQLSNAMDTFLPQIAELAFTGVITTPPFQP